MYLIKRNKVYHLYYFDKRGIPKSKSTKCTSIIDANKFLHEFLNSPKYKESELFDQSFEEYRSFYLKYAATRFTLNYQEFVKRAFSQFGRIIPGSAPIKSIKRSDVEAFITLKLTESRGMVINGYLRTLQAAFQRAVEQEYLKENVFAKIKKLKCAENQPAFLQGGEFERIHETEDDDQLKIIYSLAYYTGMRMAEIRFLKWDAIDFAGNLILVQNHNEFTTKSKRSRAIPLHPRIKELLLRMQENKSEGEYIYISEIERHFSVADETEKIIDQSLKQAERLRQSILKEAFSGKLVPQDPNDEPAEKLLERIKVEREKISKTKSNSHELPDSSKKENKKRRIK